MGKNKKPFIDKKNASTYHLLYRSQRDVAGADEEEDAAGEGTTTTTNAGVVLWPSPDNNKSTDHKVLLGSSSSSANGNNNGEDGTLGTWKQQLSQAGLVDDYDYDKHLKPITGTGKFLDVSGTRNASAMYDARSKDVEDKDAALVGITKEVDRQLESIALNAECMDQEIAAALFGDFDELGGDDGMEELDDDFMIDASKPGEGEEDEQGFDFAAHVKALMERAKRESGDVDAANATPLGTVHEHARQDQDFFRKAKPLHDSDDDDDDDSDYQDHGGEDGDDWDMDDGEAPGVVPKLGVVAEKALCDKFAATLLEYDSDEFGDMDEEEIMGPRPLEGNSQVEAALDEYLQEKDDGLFMQGARHYMEGLNAGGSGFSALVGTKMIHVKDIDEGKVAEVTELMPLDEINADADLILKDPLEAPPTEEVFIDGQSYFSEKMRNPWDCESILSTYSNMDNNPVTIGAGGRRWRKPEKKNMHQSAIHEEEPAMQILLSDKTGMPLGVLPTRGQGGQDGAGDTFVSVNKGEARKKEESIEEKKMRKLNIKKERQISRMQKKMMKEAFSDEFSKRATEVLNDDVGGKTVFRF
jgi:protein LTV1